MCVLSYLRKQTSILLTLNLSRAPYFFSEHFFTQMRQVFLLLVSSQARAMSAPPPKHAPVAPATRKFVPKPVPRIIPVKKQVGFRF